MTAFYESDRAVAEYLLFHYGAEALRMPWPGGPAAGLPFPVRCVAEGLAGVSLAPEARALDLGCAVGRATFELARHCRNVVGIDFSARFVQTAEHLRLHGELAFEAAVEGDITQPAITRRPTGIDPARVRFETGDALNLRTDLGDFDVVLAANLLDRVPRPAALLAGMATRVRPGGWLILTSPYTWMEEYTPRSEWLCGEDRSTADGLAARLPAFDLIRRWDLPFVLREHARKFQWSVADATLWQRRRG